MQVLFQDDPGILRHNLVGFVEHVLLRPMILAALGCKSVDGRRVGGSALNIILLGLDGPVSFPSTSWLNDRPKYRLDSPDRPA